MKTLHEANRMKRLPLYLFTILDDLKAKARAKGMDIIDLGMGNPDLPTPPHIVEALCQGAHDVEKHRYSRPNGPIEQELKRTPDIASQWMAEILGVDIKTVQAARRRLEATLEIPVLKKLRGKDGKNRVATYTRVIANSPRELQIAQRVARYLPPSCNGKLIDTVTASRHARRFARAEARNGRAVKQLSLD